MAYETWDTWGRACALACTIVAAPACVAENLGYITPLAGATDASASDSSTGAPTVTATAGGSGTSGGPTATDSGSGTSATSTTSPSTSTSNSTSSPATSQSSTSSDPTSTSGVGSSTGIDPNQVACSPYEQDCPGGMKCAPIDGDLDGFFESAVCVEIMGNGQPGDGCMGDKMTGEDSCAHGVYCFAGSCKPLCVGEPQNPYCEDGECVPYSGTLDLCYANCDPIGDAPCPDGETCVPFGEGYFTCFPDGDGKEYGQVCESLNACAPGLVCVEKQLVQGCAGDDCCTLFCDVNNPVTCDGNQMCMAWGNLPPDLDHVGVCVG